MSHASDSPDTRGPDLATDGRFGSFWCPAPGQMSGWLEVTLDRAYDFNTVVLVEPRSASGDYGKEGRIGKYRTQRWNGTS